MSSNPYRFAGQQQPLQQLIMKTPESALEIDFEENSANQFQRSQGINEENVPCFGLSPNKAQAISAIELQYQRKIALIQLQAAILSCVDVIEPKILHIKRKVFNSFCQSNDQESQNYCNLKQLQGIIQKSHIHLDGFINSRRISLLFSALYKIKENSRVQGEEIKLQKRVKSMATRRSSNKDRGSSNEMLRMESKLRHQNQQSSQSGVMKKNKRLKGKKMEQQKQLNSFLQSMDEMLCGHEEYLNRR